jgi:hypothetical protein
LLKSATTNEGTARHLNSGAWKVETLTAHLNQTEDEAWLPPFCYLLNLRECNKQYMGWTKPKRELALDDIFLRGFR